jgi:formate dehydrogenase
MKLSMTEVYEVATFYAHFDVVKEGETPPPPVTVRVCDSLSCAMAGADRLLQGLAETLGPERARRPRALHGRLRPRAGLRRRPRAGDEARTRAVKSSLCRRRTRTRCRPGTTSSTTGAGGYAAREALSRQAHARRAHQDRQRRGLRGSAARAFPTGRKWSLVRREPGRG